MMMEQIHRAGNDFVNNLQITAINISVDGSSIYLLYEEDPTK
jgi:hypothetical protein